MTVKKVVENFYDMDLAKESKAITMFHKDCELHWNSSKGFITLNYAKINAMLQDVQKSYISFRHRLSHLLEDGNIITARYTVYVIPIEKSEEEEEALAHFISIWEVKEGKLFRGYEISQMADENPASLKTFLEIKI
ncbi:MAG TPA: nuclear transport factor 2 family protein [Aquaticitalea sp.]|nr:nuclear transport factor 2 family protein [Aquaticitalea sp.]